MFAVQLPTFPLAGGTLASQGSGLQVAAVKFPKRHVDGPDTVNPELQVGWHDEPDARLAVQVPASPLAGGVLASQGLGLQMASFNVP